MLVGDVDIVADVDILVYNMVIGNVCPFSDAIWKYVVIGWLIVEWRLINRSTSMMIIYDWEQIPM